MGYACAFPTTLNIRSPNYRIDHPVIHSFYWPATRVDQTLRPSHWQWYDPEPDTLLDVEFPVVELERILADPIQTNDPSGEADFKLLEDQLLNELDPLR